MTAQLQPTHMLPYDMQLTNEHRFSRHHIDRYIRKEITENPWAMDKVKEGVKLIQDWMGQTFYESKQARLAQLSCLDLEEVVFELFVGTAYFQVETLFTSVSAQMAGRLRFNDKADSIRTAAELLAVLCLTDVFDIGKAVRMASLTLVSRLPLSEELMGYIYNATFLPPMVCAPETLERNYQSAYLTHNESLILGKGNHHDGDICLDVLNTQNQIPLALNIDFLRAVEEEPTYDIDTIEKAQQWEAFHGQSAKVYMLMVKQGNRFHLTHNVDMRGRIYAKGYHISTMGTAYKKASVELAEKHYVTGVPT